jgi:hypothetical protein
MTRITMTAALCLAGLSGSAWAQDDVPELPQLSSGYVKSEEAFRLAANEESVLIKKQEAAVPAVKEPEFEEPMFSGSKMHQYLGMATVGAAAATFLTHFHPCEGPNCGPQPPRDTHSTHANLGRATALLAAATVASGLMAHRDDFHMEDGITDPDNLHVLLGVSGAALMAYAINKSARSTVPTSHAAMAELGAIGMVVAIKLTW